MGGAMDVVQVQPNRAGRSSVRLDWDIPPIVRLLPHRIGVSFAQHGHPSNCGAVSGTEWLLPWADLNDAASGWLSIEANLSSSDCIMTVRVPMRTPVLASEWYPADMHRGIDIPPVRVQWYSESAPMR